MIQLGSLSLESDFCFSYGQLWCTRVFLVVSAVEIVIDDGDVDDDYYF